MKQMTRSILGVRLVGLLLGILCLSGCSPVKYVPKDKYLLSSDKLIVHGEGLSKSDLNAIARQRPNKTVFRIRFGLWMYNLSSTKNRAIDRWFRSSGEAPVIYDTLQLNVTSQRLSAYAAYRGYYGTTVSSQVMIDSARRRANVTYTVNLAKPVIIRKMAYMVQDTLLDTTLITAPARRQVNEGDIFDEELLEKERARITADLANVGYWRFTNSYIKVQADTTMGHRQADLRVIVQREQVGRGNDTTTRSHRLFYIKHITTMPLYESDVPGTMSAPLAAYDTLRRYGITMLKDPDKKIVLKPSMIAMSNAISLMALFKDQEVTRTYANFYNLGLFKGVNIRMSEMQPSKEDTLNFAHLTNQVPLPLSATIMLSPFKLQRYTIGGEVSVSGSGLFGFATTLNYQHKNIFGGAEILDTRVSMEFQKVQVVEKGPLENSIEFGAMVGLNVPRFMMPIKIQRYNKVFSPRTQFVVSADFQRIPDYSRWLSSASLGYSWRNQRMLTFILKPVDITIINITTRDSSFFNRIKGNPYLLNAYRNTFLLGSQFSVIYGTRAVVPTRPRLFVRFDTEFKGNVLWALSSLVGAKQIEDAGLAFKTYEVWHTTFAQFAKFDVTVNYYRPVTETTAIAARFLAGIGIAYGNSLSLPFDKMYFAGGSNSMRGWQIRTLGPGGYRPPGNNISILNHLADMKLEANFEYRFKLFWRLEGALFADAGNVWSINPNDVRPDARIEWNTLLSEIAINWGAGVRVNFGVLVVRLDYGIRLRDPARESTYFVNPNGWMHKNNTAFFLALDYPF